MTLKEFWTYAMGKDDWNEWGFKGPIIGPFIWWCIVVPLGHVASYIDCAYWWIKDFKKDPVDISSDVEDNNRD